MVRYYRGASRREKRQLLDEFTRVTGYHRKSAIRLLSGVKSRIPSGRRGRTPEYGLGDEGRTRGGLGGLGPSLWEAFGDIHG